jgi:hypothetical protein
MKSQLAIYEATRVDLLKRVTSAPDTDTIQYVRGVMNAPMMGDNFAVRNVERNLAHQVKMMLESGQKQTLLMVLNTDSKQALPLNAMIHRGGLQ